ncbi:extracellular calcium-sensing receptor-like [Protopterus annectens]|uniref:extracellular calcium-sensing receptor-like n=1 Tax=Protopterus annectens TaxID=7888 RepID=UPI001CFC00F2|nr:extracellular calcium-sensing receptor-like [Protopterus annectens]
MKNDMVSHGSVLSLLSDKNQFPSFLRTVPNDGFQSLGLALLVQYFQWTWIGIIATDNDFGQLGSQNVRNHIFSMDGCIAFIEYIPVYYSEKKISHIVDVIKMSSVNVVVMYASMENLVKLMETIALQNITGKVWISSTGLYFSSDFTTKDILKTFKGTIGFAHHRGEIPGLREFLYSVHPSRFPDDILIKYFWEQAFGCQWPQQNDSFHVKTFTQIVRYASFCTGLENLDKLEINLYDVHNFRFTYGVYKAVYALAHALHKILTCSSSYVPTTESCLQSLTIQPWKLLRHAKTIHFKNRNGEDVYFDDNGDPPACYDILNFQLLSDGSSRYTQVGSFDSTAPKGHEISINETAVIWHWGYGQTPVSVCSDLCPTGYRKSLRRGQPVCCFDCVICSKGHITNQSDSRECQLCPVDQWPNEKHDRCIPKDIEFLTFSETLGGVLTSATGVCSTLAAFVLYIFVKNKETPIVKANNRELSYVLLFALLLGSLSPLLFIGRPTSITCMLQQTLFGIAFSICVSSILAKTVMVVIAFRATDPTSGLKKYLGSAVPNLIVIFCSGLQGIICMVWTATFPPFLQFTTSSETAKVIIECKEGSVVFFYVMLAYMGLLACVSFAVAFAARKLPDIFNEAKHITFSMLVFASVWLAFIPAYLSTQGKYMVAVEIFAILSTSAGILICIFFPKCYIILFRPQKNTKEHLIGKRHI